MDTPKAEEHMLKGTTGDTLEDTSKAKELITSSDIKRY